MVQQVHRRRVNSSNSRIALRTDGRKLEVGASGDAADFLAGVLGLCLIALTIRAIAK